MTIKTLHYIHITLHHTAPNKHAQTHTCTQMRACMHYNYMPCITSNHKPSRTYHLTLHDNTIHSDTLRYITLPWRGMTWHDMASQWITITFHYITQHHKHASHVTALRSFMLRCITFTLHHITLHLRFTLHRITNYMSFYFHAISISTFIPPRPKSISMSMSIPCRFHHITLHCIMLQICPA